MDTPKTETLPPHEPLFHPIPAKFDRDNRFEKPTGSAGPERSGGPADWIINGVVFPHGTKFRGKYKGYFYAGEVLNGALMVNGKPFFSPSAASGSITRNSIDGWLFWDCRLPGCSAWINISELKKSSP